MPEPDASTDNRLRELARAAVLLVACDFDGTLAPLVDDPARAVGNADSLRALRLLAGLPHTHVAVVSGRSLRDLALLSRLPSEVHLVGSHGSEFDVGISIDIDEAARDRLADINRELDRLVANHDGIGLEVKPASIALHYRTADRETASAVVDAVLKGPATREGVYVKHGKMVVELAVVHADKGESLRRLRQELGASAVLFFGDDVTDEDAFATLSGPDLGIKVGEGDTRAALRLADTEQVSHSLAKLYEARRDWVLGTGALPIERHSLLSNGKHTAIVNPRGRIVWLCFPRPDSPALFSELVGGEPAGYFDVASARNAAPLAQRYVGDSMIVQTRWPGFTVHDYFDDPPAEREDQNAPLRLLRCLSGSEVARITFAPRPDYSTGPVSLTIERDEQQRPIGLVASGSSLPIALRAPGVEWTLREDGVHVTATADVDLRNGPVLLELRCGTRDLADDYYPEMVRRQRAKDAWSSWAERLHLPTIETDAARRSALTLKGLCYHPTGAFLAAATTSLPAHLGGVRNWDYRYAWLRDGALSARALVRVGSNEEAMQFIAWLAGVFEKVPDADRIMPLYTVTGSELGVEAVLAQLPGYAGSRPVRVGNAALHQVQLDVFGPVLDLMYELCLSGIVLDRRQLAVADMMVGAVSRRWHEPDHGIWEVRIAPRHHVHSKVMCWVAVDRAIAISAHNGVAARPEWTALRDEIRDDILLHGWDDKVGSFVVAYGVPELDASVLQLVSSGMLPAEDERARATLRAIEVALRDGPTVYRYRYDDGIAGHDSGFHLCTGWLIEAYVKAGRVDDAYDLFKQMLTLAGPTGLLSEGYDPRTDRALGNFPQAYSHIAVVDSAYAISRWPGN
jgi:trehalose-phosphatase